MNALYNTASDCINAVVSHLKQPVSIPARVDLPQPLHQPVVLPVEHCVEHA